MELIYLTQENLVSAGLLDFQQALSAVETGLVWHTSKKSRSGKTSLSLDDKLEWKFNSLAAVNGNYAGCKWLGSNVGNKELGMPRTTATIVLNDKQTGVPLCIMDGTAISAIRTGCYAALGLKYLGHDTNVVGIIGSGVMAKTALLSIAQNMPEKVKKVLVYSKTPDHSEDYVEEMRERTGLEIYQVRDVGALVRQSDFTVSAITKSDELLTRLEDVKPGSTRVQIGGWGDETAYVLECVRNGKAICDDWYKIKSRNAHPLPIIFNQGEFTDDQIYGDIGEIILGEKPGREGNELIYFDTVGLGEMDLVMASRLYERAVEMGIGQPLKLWDEPVWLLKGYDNQPAREAASYVTPIPIQNNDVA